MPSIGTFKSHVGFASEATYGTTVAAPTVWIPALSYDTFEDDQGHVLDEGGRAKASKVYASYQGIEQGKGAYTFPYYPNECGRFWPRLLGTDTVGSSSNAYWQHTMTLGDLPISDTVFDFFGSTGSAASGAEFQFVGAQYHGLDFKFDRKSGLATIKPSFMSAAPSSGIAETTPSYGTDPALRGYEAVFSIAGSTRVTLLTYEVSLKRDVELIFGGNNSFRPSDVQVGTFDVSGKIEFYGSTAQPYDDYRANTQQVIDLVLTDTLAGSSGARLEILLTKAVFTKVTPDRSGKYLRYSAEFRGIHNATDAGPIQILTTVATSSAY